MRLVPVVAVSDPLTVPTWLTAVLTGVLAVGAIVTAVFAFKAFGKQSQEVADQAALLKIQSDQLDAQRQQLAEQQKINAQQIKVLELQARELSESIDERKRDADDQRRSRAALIYMTVDFDRGLRDVPGMIMVPRGPSVEATVHNTGSQPIYDVRVHWVDARTVSQGGSEDQLGTIPPGQDGTAKRDLPDGTAELHLVAVAYFRDAAGLRWTLMADGQLGEADPAAPPGAPVIAITAVMRARGQI